MIKSSYSSAILASVLTAVLVLEGPVAARELGSKLGASAATTQTTVPVQVNLKSSTGSTVNGLTNLTFSFYSAASGGSPTWTEAWTGGNAVLVTNGVASVLLGSLNPLNQSLFASTVYLGITVNAESEMQPRIQLGSAPVAMSVPDGSITTSKIADLAVAPRNIAAKSYRVDTGPYSSSPFTVTTSPTAVTGFEVVVPAADVPVDTLALILVSIECLNSGATTSVTYVPWLDGGSPAIYQDYQYENAWQANEWRKLVSHMVVPLAANTDHPLAVFMWTSTGIIVCYNRHESITLLGGQ